MNWILYIPKDTHHAIMALMSACVLPFIFAFLAKMTGGFDLKKDNQNPRAFLAQTKGLSSRLNAVQANSFESLPSLLERCLSPCTALSPKMSSTAWRGCMLCYASFMAWRMP